MLLTQNSRNFSFLALIFLLSIQSISSLLCYDCKDCTEVSCSCNYTVNVDAQDSYCILLRENLPSGANFEIRPIPKETTNPYENNPHYISVIETIFYNETMDKWSEEMNRIVYACQTDRCNQPDLLKQLPPNGLSLTLPDNWLNDNLIRRKDQKTTLCNECPEKTVCGNTPYFIDPSQCQLQECGDFCAMDEIIKTDETGRYCYQSFCISSDNQVPSVRINGVYFIRNQNFDIMETDLLCRGVNCNRLEIFKDIKEKVQKDYNGIKAFLPANGVNSIYSRTLILLLFIVLVENLSFY